MGSLQCQVAFSIAYTTALGKLGFHLVEPHALTGELISMSSCIYWSYKERSQSNTTKAVQVSA